MTRAVGLLLALLLGGCTTIDGQARPTGGSGPITSQVDVQLRPVEQAQPGAAAEFGAWTAAHVGEQLAVVVDGEVVTAPTIQTAITG